MIPWDDDRGPWEQIRVIRAHPRNPFLVLPLPAPVRLKDACQGGPKAATRRTAPDL